jgi:hypothetical protein
MRAVSKIACLFICLGGFSPFLAGADEDTSYRQIKGDELRAVFSETKVIAEYQSVNGGIKHFRYTEHHFSDGTTDYVEQGQETVKGAWNIVGDDKICYRYKGNEVFNQTYCFFVYQSGSCYFNYGLGAMTLKGARNWEFWTSRFIREGDGGTCTAPVS